MLKTPRKFFMSRNAVGVLVALTLLLAACGGQVGDSWAGLKLDPDQSVVYMSFGDKVVALQTTDGTTLWEYPPKDDRGTRFFAIPAIDGGTLYIGDWDGSLHAINTADGTANWIYKPDEEKIIGPLSLKASDRIISGVALDSDKIFFGLGSENIVALSRSTAEEVWTFQTDHGVWGTPLYLPADAETGTAAILYAISLDHRLYAIDPDSGDEVWSLNLDGAAPGNVLYDAESNRLYVGTFASELVAVDLEQQDIVARYKTEGWMWGGPALDVQEDGTKTLYFADIKGYVYAIQPADNDFVEVWKRRVADDAIRSTPLLLEDRLLVGSQDQHIYAINKDSGTMIWDNEAGGEVLSEFVSVSQDDEASTLVIVSTSSGDDRLVAYDSKSGERVWRYPN